MIHTGRVTFINPAGLRVLGYTSSDEIIGKEEHALFHHTHTDGRPFDVNECQICDAWSRGLSGHSEDEYFWRKNGQALAVEYHVHPLRDEGRVVGAVVNFSDISVRKELQETIWRQANYDNLTGIANRSLLMDRMKLTIEQAKRGQFRLALLFIDLNRFKPINDEFGHEAGDEVLRTVALRIKGRMRSSDTVARMGGDEFVVILNQVNSAEDAERFAGELGELIRQPIDIGTTEVNIDAAIGISMFPEDGDNCELLLSRADQAMYRQKDSGERER